MKIETVGELLHWSYANLAMAHAAASSGAKTYGRTHYMIRARLYAGLRKGSMQLGSLADDERLKMILPQACCYCASRDHLSIDHLIPRSRGGADTGDNLVWACRTCNSSKGATDVLTWLSSQGRFPPLLLLRRYLKLAIAISTEQGAMETPISQAQNLAFSLSSVPTQFPAPTETCLWVTELPTATG
jgi:hypothetical protein